MIIIFVNTPLADHIKNSSLPGAPGVKIHQAAAVKEICIISIIRTGNTGLLMIPGILLQQRAGINIEMTYVIVLIAVPPALSHDGEELSANHMNAAQAGAVKSLRRDQAEDRRLRHTAGFQINLFPD